MKTLTICLKDGSEQILTITSEAAEAFMVSNELIYSCGSDEHPDHDYHLNPQKLFTSEDVEFLLGNLE